MVKTGCSVALLVGLVACGNSSHGSPDASPGADATPDAAPDGPFVAGSHDSLPVVQDMGGPVMATPHVVPIFFTGDTTAQADMTTFLAMLAASPYWQATTGEYGVGALTIDTPIVIDQTLSSPIDDTALRAMLVSNLDGTHAGWTYDANAIYTLFTPDGVTVTNSNASSCTAFGGYHSNTQTATQQPFPYVVVPRCANFQLSAATSHELVEAVTDPLPMTAPAYVTLDAAHAVWGYYIGGSEVADMCATLSDVSQPLVGTYAVMRSWSNASAAAGHSPCVPAIAGPYRGVATVLPDTKTIGGAGVTTQVVNVAVGSSRMIDVHVYTDAPSTPFAVRATTVSAPARITLAWASTGTDTTMANNGDTLQLVITRAAPASPIGDGFELIVGASGTKEAVWLGAAF